MANAKSAWRNGLAFTLALDIGAATLVTPGLVGKVSIHRFTRSRLDSRARPPQTVTFDAEPFFRSHVRQRRLRGRFRL